MSSWKKHCVWLTAINTPKALYVLAMRSKYTDMFFCVWIQWLLCHCIQFYFLVWYFSLFTVFIGLFIHSSMFFLCKQGPSLNSHLRFMLKKSLTLDMNVSAVWLTIKATQPIMFLLFVVIIRQLGVQLNIKYFKS